MTAEIINFDVARSQRVIKQDKAFDKKRNLMLRNAQVLADAGMEDAAKATIDSFAQRNDSVYR